MSPPRPLAAVLVCALTSAACTHTMEVRSEPPGAEVLLDGEPVGTTPVAIERPTSHADVRTLVVRHAGEEARLAVLEDGWGGEPILLTLVAALATGGCGVGVIGLGYVTSLLFAISPGSNVGVLTAGVFGGLALVFVGVLAVATSTYLPFVGIGELARVGPDEVFVDFTRADVTSSPTGRVQPLVGVSEGYRPLRADDDGAATPSPRDAPPSPPPG